MSLFRRTPHAQPASWAAELVELAALFVAVGLAHLFVSLLGHRAEGPVVLLISGVALIVAVLGHRWRGARSWGGRSRGTRSRRQAERDRPHLASGLRELLELPGEDREMWQLRTTLRDRPGSLAALSGKLAALNVNILAIQVHPTKNGVADELLVAAPQGVTVREIAAAIDAGGGADIVVAAADTHDLVDPPTRALALAVRAATDSRSLPHALAELLRATTVGEPAPVGASDADGTKVQIRDHTGTLVTLSRPGLPFTPAELSRAQALIDLCARLGPTTEVRC
jgi:predicted amino acid-binding ACT domain protein